MLAIGKSPSRFEIRLKTGTTSFRISLSFLMRENSSRTDVRSFLSQVVTFATRSEMAAMACGTTHDAPIPAVAATCAAQEMSLPTRSEMTSRTIDRTNSTTALAPDSAPPMPWQSVLMPSIDSARNPVKVR